MISKKTWFILLSFLFVLSTNLSFASNYLSDFEKPSHLKSDTAYFAKQLDSIIYYSFSHGTFVNKYKFNIYGDIEEETVLSDIDTLVYKYTYDYKNKIDTSWYFNVVNKQLQLYAYHTIQKNANGDVIAENSFEYDTTESVWIQTVKRTTTYTTDNQKLVYESYVLDDESGELEGEQRTVNEYDGNGNLIETILFLYNDHTQIWRNYKKSEFIYKNNQLFVSESYLWNDALKQWEQQDMIEYEYDTNGNKIREEEFDWHESFKIWTEIKKEQWVYDSLGKQNEYMIFLGLLSPTLEPLERFVYEYDSNGILSKETIYYGDDDEWELNLKYEYQNDSTGNVLEKNKFLWVDTSSNWKLDESITRNYSANGDLKNELTRVWIDSLNALENFKKTVLEYDSTALNKDLIFSTVSTHNILLYKTDSFWIETDEWDFETSEQFYYSDREFLPRKDTFYVNIDTTICGEELTILGKTYTKSGVYEYSAVSASADSFIVVNLMLLPKPQINLPADTILQANQGSVFDIDTETSNYAWSSVDTNSNIFYFSSGKLVNEMELFLEVADINGCKQNHLITVITNFILSSTNTVYLENNEGLYPNPATLHFNTPWQFNDETLLELYNANGQKVKEILLKDPQTVYINELEPGVYIYTITDKNIRGKLLKK